MARRRAAALISFAVGPTVLPLTLADTDSPKRLTGCMGGNAAFRC